MCKYNEPWTQDIDDTGGPFSGWPSILAREEADLTVIHRAGFKQEFWGDLSQRDAVKYARRITMAVNACAGLSDASLSQDPIGKAREALEDIWDASFCDRMTAKEMRAAMGKINDIAVTALALLAMDTQGANANE